MVKLLEILYFLRYGVIRMRARYYFDIMMMTLEIAIFFTCFPSKKQFEGMNSTWHNIYKSYNNA